MERMTDAAVVVGGGIAGLVSAIHLARAGRRVTVLERALRVGGRAASAREGGFVLNQGAHALYAGGAARRVLAELGVVPAGRKPRPAGYLQKAGSLRLLPATPWSALATRAIGLSAKVELAKLVRAIVTATPEEHEHTSIASFLDARAPRPDVRAIAEAIIRIATYGGEPDAISAAVALSQTQKAIRDNVYYLDGGWQTIVDALRAVAGGAGVTIRESTRAAEIVLEDGRVRGVQLEEGSRIDASTAILALPPAAASALVLGGAHPALAGWARDARPVRVASLDLALSSLPVSRHTLVVGTDAPLYLSVHSAVADLAPPPGAVVHVMKYLGTSESDPAADRAELEALLDLAQPGWRERVVAAKWLPRMIVHHDLPTAARGGLRGRPGPAVPGVTGLFVASDWVGTEGLLADAALASARLAARLATAGEPGALCSYAA
jgi:phytoene dehydrogenase-like protein